MCAPVHVYDESDRCWTAIVNDFNAYWAALPTGRWHSLLAGHNCTVQGPGMAGNVYIYISKAQSHDEGKGRRRAREVHRSVTGVKKKGVTGMGMYNVSTN